MGISKNWNGMQCTNPLHADHMVHMDQRSAPSGTTTAHLSIFLLPTSQYFEIA